MLAPTFAPSWRPCSHGDSHARSRYSRAPARVRGARKRRAIEFPSDNIFSGSLATNFVLAYCSQITYSARMLGNAEVEVITPGVSPADLRRASALYRLAAMDAPLSGGRVTGSSETRPMTGRVSGTMDLAATIRLCAGNDLTPQWCGMSSAKELAMYKSNAKPWRQRSKSGKKWPKWLRNPRLLRWIICIGMVAYRLWRWWLSLTGSSTDG